MNEPKLIYTAPTEQEAREHLERLRSQGLHVSIQGDAKMILRVMLVDNQEETK